MEASGGADTAPISAAPMCRYADTPEAPCADMPISGVCRYADIGIEALRGDIGISAAPIAEDPEPLGDAGWRVEVLKRGKYWQWRKGHGRNRKARYGGRFALLPPERQAAYFENVRRRAHSSDGPGDLPAGRAGGQPGRGGRVLVAL
jgi:hypothetical protein